jgi:hemerythrin
MTRIRWSRRLSVGVDEIDAQHQEWIRHHNLLADAVGRHEGPVRLGQVLGFLLDYVTGHFAAEERLMADHGYPDRASHAARHAEFKAILGDLVRDYREEGASNRLATAVDGELRAWLVQHITTVDLRLGEFLKKGGYGPGAASVGRPSV